MWGSCFWLCTCACALPLPPAAHTQLTHTHTTCPRTTYSLTTCPRTTCPHTTYSHTTCTHNLSPNNLLTHNLSPHNLSPHNLLTHNLLTHNLLTHNLLTAVGVAGMALGDIDLHFARQAWHLVTWTCILRGRRGTYGIWWRAWFPVDAAVRAAVCVAGVALGDICLHFAWQAWHLRDLVARSVPSGTPRSPRMFAWPAWHLATSAFTLRGRRGTWRHRPSLCAASVALTASGGALGSHWTPRLFAWQAWHLATSAFTLRRLGVAGVALGDIDLHFAWQAWHLWHWTGSGEVLGSRWTRGTRGTYATGLALVARLVPSGRRGRPRLFAWRAWRLATSAFTLRGRRGTWRHLPSLCVAGVALGDMDLHFAWQV